MPEAAVLDADTKRALRLASYVMVNDYVAALMAQGLSRTEACKAVRWATHKIENDPEPEGDTSVRSQ